MAAGVRASNWRTTDFNGWTGVDQETEDRAEGFSTYAQPNGFLGRGFVGPLSFRVVESSGGVVLQDDAWTEPDPGTGYLCTRRWNVAGGTTFYFCSYAGALSSFQLFRNSGTVTYHSRGYRRSREACTGNESVYHWNYSVTRRSAPPHPIAGDDQLRLSFFSANGEETRVQADVGLAPFTDEHPDPVSCHESGDPSWG